MALQSNYCQILEKNGHDVLLARSNAHFDAEHTVYPKNILLDKRKGKINKIAEAITRYRQLTPFHPDLMFFDLPSHVPELMLGIALAMKFPLVTMIHDAQRRDDSDDLGAVERLLTRILVKRSKALLCFSNDAAIHLRNRYPDKAVFSVPLLPSLPPRTENAFTDERRNFAMIGRWSEYKGFDLGLKIWEAYTSKFKTDSVLDMWCSGLDEPLITPENVRWRAVKRYDWDEFDLALRRYRAVLMPYRKASQSGVQILAWDVGVPALIADLPGLVELQPKCLPSIDVNDLGGWIDAIRKLDSSEISVELGRLGMQESKEMRSDARVLDVLEKCIESVLA